MNQLCRRVKIGGAGLVGQWITDDPMPTFARGLLPGRPMRGIAEQEEVES